MRTKILVMAVVAFSFMLATAWGADIAGTWKGEMAGMGGQPMEITFTFEVDGSEFTGTSAAMGNESPISEGKIDGDDISFVVKVDMMGNEMEINYKGKIVGEEIKLTMEMDMGGMGGPPGGGAPGGGGPGGGMGGPPEITLKRVE